MSEMIDLPVGNVPLLLARGQPFAGTVVLGRNLLPWARERLTALQGRDLGPMGRAYMAQLQAAIQIANERRHED